MSVVSVRLLPAFVVASVSSSVAFGQVEEPHSHGHADELIVVGSPLGRTNTELATPVTVFGEARNFAQGRRNPWRVARK